MKQSELQTPISQLFNALKSHFFLHVNIFRIFCSEQLNKTHNFRKNHFCDVIILELYMASSDSQIDRPQCGCPKRAELPDGNIIRVHKALILREL